MKKFTYTLILIFYCSLAFSQWNNVGGATWQISSDGYNLRMSTTLNGLKYFYQKAQVDSLVAALRAVGITGLTGDGTATGPGNVAFTLATVNSNTGSFGTASNVPTYTVNGKGLMLSSVNTPILITEGQVTNLSSDLAGKQPQLNGTGFVKATGTTISYDNSTYLTTISGTTAGGDLSGTYPNPSVNTINGITKSFYDPTSSIQSQLNSKQPNGSYITGVTGDITASGPGSVAATLATVNSNTGSFGTASNVPTITINGKGLTTAANNTPIQIAESQVTNLPSDLANTVSISNTRRSANFGISGSLSNVGDLSNTGSSDNTFTASGWVKIDALASGESLTFYVTYTDNEGLVSTIPMTLYGTASTTAITSSSIAVYSLNAMQMRVKAGTDVIISSVLTGSGTNNYACGVIITNVQGF